jgi:mono/diheme cytochrome c family protein
VRLPTPLLALVALLAAALLAGAVLLRRDPRERNWEVVPADMARTPALVSGALTDAFEDGLVQRAPPEGTVPRGLPPLGYGPSLEEAARAGRELVNPVPANPRELARGEAVFRSFCAACHGLSGLGDAPVTKRGVPPPPSLLRPESRALPDGEMFHAVTYGRKNMPSHASQVERDDRWRAIRWVRSLQEAAR